MITSEDVQLYVLDLKKEFPGLEIYRDKPWWLSFPFRLPLLRNLNWNNYTQTIGGNIYLAANWDRISPTNQLFILIHERIHLLQFQKYGIFLMSFLYLFLFFPIGLAYFRARFEREALRETIRVRVEYYGEHHGELHFVRRSMTKRYLQFFTTSAYLYMWPFKRTVLRWFEEDWETVAGKIMSKE